MAHARTDSEQREHDVINRAHDRRVEKVKRLVQVVHLGQDAADDHLEARGGSKGNSDGVGYPQHQEK